MVVDVRKNEPPPSLVCINGTDVEIVQAYRYLGVYLDNKTKVVYKKGPS